MTTFINKTTKEQVEVDIPSLVGKSTNTLYIRKGYMNGTLFLSQRGSGAYGAGDVCPIHAAEVIVADSLFNRIKILAAK